MTEPGRAEETMELLSDIPPIVGLLKVSLLRMLGRQMLGLGEKNISESVTESASLMAAAVLCFSVALMSSCLCLSLS